MADMTNPREGKTEMELKQTPSSDGSAVRELTGKPHAGERPVQTNIFKDM
jgi:hypothetical protein